MPLRSGKWCGLFSKFQKNNVQETFYLRDFFFDINTYPVINVLVQQQRRKKQENT